MAERVDFPRQAAFAALGAVLVLDRVLARLPLRPISGVVDEAAHLATGAIVLAALPAPELDFVGGLAAGSILIDVDHVPELWGRAAWLRPRGVRPLPHSLVTPALALWTSARRHSRFYRGAAVGLAAHLLRDLATGTTGVALLWPLTRRPFSIRYRTYVALLVCLAGYAAGGEPPAPAAKPAPEEGLHGHPTPGPAAGEGLAAP